MLLLCSFFRLKELFQVKNGVTTSLLFFFENARNLGRSDDSKRRKKRGWPNRKRIEIMINNVVLLSSPVLHSLGLVIRTKNILKRMTKSVFMPVTKVPTGNE